MTASQQIAQGFEQDAASNLRQLTARGGQPTQVATALAGAAQAQALLAISHRLADLTEVLRARADG